MQCLQCVSLAKCSHVQHACSVLVPRPPKVCWLGACHTVHELEVSRR